MRVSIPESCAVFGDNPTGTIYQLDCTEAVAETARNMGWLGSGAQLHTMMPDLARETVNCEDIQADAAVHDQIKIDVKKLIAEEEAARRKPGCSLTSSVDRSGRVFVFNCHYDNRGIAKDAGFQWSGRLWWTDRPSIALKLVEYANSPALAAELSASVIALPPVLRPQGKLASTLITDIRFKDNAIVTDFPAKDEHFLAVIKNARFHWDGARWMRTVTVKMGDPIDRLADIAHTLLAEGFLVRVHNAEAQAKVISGEFELEQTRWVSRAMGTARWDGWFALNWARTDDIYKIVKSLPGATYVKGAVLCPPGAFEEVSDFAVRMGFALTPGAEEIIDQQRAAVIGGITVAPVKRKAKPVAPKKGAPMEAVDEGIDPSLMDEFEGLLS